MIDGLYLVDWDTKISNVLSPQNDETAEHSSIIQNLIICNEGVFITNGMAIRTPFVKLHRKKYGDGIYLDYQLADNALVNHHLPALKGKFTECWFTPWEVNKAHFSFHFPISSL